MNTDIFQKRRTAWAETATKLPRHTGPAKKLLQQGQNPTYSFLGTGLMAHMAHDPGYIEWREPEPWLEGQTFQAVDDTTETIADYYAITTELVDLLDEMDSEGMPDEELNEMVRKADYSITAPNQG